MNRPDTPTLQTHLHRRQFIIAPTPLEVRPGWVTAPVPGAGYLHHCPELRVVSGEDAEGKPWHLLGTAVQTDSSKSDPAAELSLATNDTLQETYHSWSGRWLLIRDGQLHLDASGLLGCFYSVKETGTGGKEVWVSSSPALLAEVLELDATPLRTLEHGRLDWYTPPQSRFKSVQRLLVSQVLALADGSLSPRRLIPELSPLSYEEALDRLQDYLLTTLSNIAKLSGNLYIALTGGYDSRLILAAALHAGLPVRTFLCTYRYTPDEDLSIPPKLAEAVGVEHSIHGPQKYRKDLAELYDQHTAKHCVELDRYYFSHGQFDWCRKGDVILRGGGFEMGRYVNRLKFPPETHPELPTAETLAQGYKDPHPKAIQGLEAWLSWTVRHPEAMDWRERLLLEQRLAGWLSSLEQSLDLIEATSLHPANSHRFFSYVLQVPPEKRQRSQHHIDLIRRMAPDLLDYPFTLKKSKLSYKRIFRKLEKVAKHYLHLGH